ncbi:C39 family peptidase [Patescibacteria group bacterium]|nr:C39 family peptidase [Patescibacteria group bacterium]
MKNLTKILLLAAAAAIIAAAIYFYPRHLSPEESVDLEKNETEDTHSVSLEVESEGTKDSDQLEGTNEETSNTEQEKVEKQSEPEPIPASHQLTAAFIPQAPFHDWSEPWQNACEEAALLVAHHYIQGDKTVPPAQVKQEIQAMLNWQDKYYGTHKDLVAAEVAEMAREYLGYEDVEVAYDITIEDIKREVTADNPVIIPAAGRTLNNPNYTAPGPVYHMLTAIGYTESTIITNDPGTRKGAGFTFTYDNFYNSIHDFVAGANAKPALMGEGRRAMVVVNK